MSSCNLRPSECWGAFFMPFYCAFAHPFCL
nr:MAG TPA: hypothetical protein [Caudoviricetes sp.]